MINESCTYPSTASEICVQTHKNIIKASNNQTVTKSISILPRVVLECSVREQLLKEAEFSLLQNRLYSMEAETQDLVSSLEQRERDCTSLQRQLADLHVSHSWRITAPLRVLGQLFRATSR